MVSCNRSKKTEKKNAVKSMSAHSVQNSLMHPSIMRTPNNNMMKKRH